MVVVKERKNMRSNNGSSRTPMRYVLCIQFIYKLLTPTLHLIQIFIFVALKFITIRAILRGTYRLYSVLTPLSRLLLLPSRNSNPSLVYIRQLALLLCLPLFLGLVKDNSIAELLLYLVFYHTLWPVAELICLAMVVEDFIDGH